MFATRRVTSSDFELIAGIIDASYRPHDPEGSMPGRHPTALDGPPFSWWGDPTLSWWIASLDGWPSAFAMWRHQERNAHLHSFFVTDEAQRRGVGTAFIGFHFSQAEAENPALDSFTLHVRREAEWARRFYTRHGYVVRDPHSVTLDEQSGLSDWVRTYVRFGWPEEGKLLLHRPKSPPLADRSAAMAAGGS
jgi:GNAT superfamily N-acetyltransferase